MDPSPESPKRRQSSAQKKMIQPNSARKHSKNGTRMSMNDSEASSPVQTPGGGSLRESFPLGTPRDIDKRREIIQKVEKNWGGPVNEVITTVLPADLALPLAPNKGACPLRRGRTVLSEVDFEAWSCRDLGYLLELARLTEGRSKLAGEWLLSEMRKRLGGNPATVNSRHGKWNHQLWGADVWRVVDIAKGKIPGVDFNNEPDDDFDEDGAAPRRKIVDIHAKVIGCDVPNMRRKRKLEQEEGAVTATAEADEEPPAEEQALSNRLRKRIRENPLESPVTTTDTSTNQDHKETAQAKLPQLPPLVHRRPGRPRTNPSPPPALPQTPVSSQTESPAGRSRRSNDKQQPNLGSATSQSGSNRNVSKGGSKSSKTLRPAHGKSSRRSQNSRPLLVEASAYDDVTDKELELQVLKKQHEIDMINLQLELHRRQRDRVVGDGNSSEAASNIG